MISVVNSAIEEYTKCMDELEVLTSKPGAFTSKDEKRHSFLLAKAAGLKKSISDVTPSEWRRYEKDKFLEAAGMPRAPEMPRNRYDEEVEREWRMFFKGQHRPTKVPSDMESRANEAGTQSISYTSDIPGGAFVPIGCHSRAFETMRQYDEIFDPRYSNIIETATGDTTTFPTWDDVSNSAVQVSEAAQSNEVDIANFGNTTLNAWTFRSKIVGVSVELLQDSNFPIGMILERVFAMRLARGVGAAMVSGSGVNSPNGLITATVASGASPQISSGASSNDGGAETSANSISTLDLTALFGKLDKSYRAGACFAMSDVTLQYLHGLLDKQGRPILHFGKGYHDSVTDETPYLLGKPVAVCPSFPTMASGHNSVVFYNPFYFIQRRVPSSMYIRKFDQNPTLVLNGLVGFEEWLRIDCNLVAPNVNYLPSQYIQQHS